MIHTLFFGGKKMLTHRNRLDFIEIFYILLTLKLIEESSPDSMSFTCKDALDTGIVHSAELFAFLRLLNDPSPCHQGRARLLRLDALCPCFRGPFPGDRAQGLGSDARGHQPHPRRARGPPHRHCGWLRPALQAAVL